MVVILVWKRRNSAGQRRNPMTLSGVMDPQIVCGGKSAIYFSVLQSEIIIFFSDYYMLFAVAYDMMLLFTIARVNRSIS